MKVNKYEDSNTVIFIITITEQSNQIIKTSEYSYEDGLL